MLSIKNIKKSYQNYLACNNINISFQKGKIIGLFGANGAGKSSCFHIITGLIKPDSGNIYIDDKNITQLPIHKRAKLGLSFLPQDKSIFQGMSVEQNIASILELSSRSRNEQKKRLEELIDRFGLNKSRHTLGSLLSGGERRRTEIARAMANKPQYILLDEPFSGVDPISIQEIKNLLKELQEQDKIGILITDHNVGATLPICDYAYIIHKGEILTEGTQQDIQNCKLARQYYLGDSLI
ncbi:MAG: LPS export ABC transporter ATP-binding protein [Pseudomonadota bacterium]|nr:LPS export ABC transporter ATP-binding protein [Pseudomonadota bacterium]